MASVVNSLDFQSDDDEDIASVVPAAGNSIVPARRRAAAAARVPRETTAMLVTPRTRAPASHLATSGQKRVLPPSGPETSTVLSSDGTVATCDICLGSSQASLPAAQHERELVTLAGRHVPYASVSLEPGTRIASTSLPVAVEVAVSTTSHIAG